MAGLQDISPMVAKRVGDQRRARAHARGRGRGLAAGMAAADNDDVEACRSRLIGIEPLPPESARTTANRQLAAESILKAASAGMVNDRRFT